MAPNPNEVMKILAEEYGIRTAKDLDEAIRKLGFINIGPFCAKQNEKEAQARQTGEKTADIAGNGGTGSWGNVRELHFR